MSATTVVKPFSWSRAEAILIALVCGSLMLLYIYIYDPVVDDPNVLNKFDILSLVPGVVQG